MVLIIGDASPTACTKVGKLPIRPLKKDESNANTIQFLTPTPAPFLHTPPLASLESSDPLAGMQKVFNDNGLKVCNTIDGDHPTPWGKRHMPFYLFLGGCRPVRIDIDWVVHALNFGDVDLIPQKLPDRDFPGIVGWFDPEYPFSFRNNRGIDANPFKVPSLNVTVEGKWFDELFVNEDPEGLDEGIHFTESTPVLNEENDYVTFQARIRRSFHIKNNPIVQTFDNFPKAWQDMRTITCEEANDVLGTEETAVETDSWIVLGTNAGIPLDNEGADPDLEPDGFAYLIDIEYQYSIA